MEEFNDVFAPDQDATKQKRMTIQVTSQVNPAFCRGLFIREQKVVVDQKTKETRPGFLFQFKQKNGKNKGDQMYVCADKGMDIKVMLKQFEKFIQKEAETIKQQHTAPEENKKKQATGVMATVVKTLKDYPDLMTGEERKSTVKNPSNLATGLGYGVTETIKGIVSGVGGLFYEPYKGARQNGFTGAMIGATKGTVGLVSKPLGGLAGLVQCTVQGAINTPGSVSRITKKQPKQEDIKLVDRIIEQHAQDIVEYQKEKEKVDEKLGQLEKQQQVNDPNFQNNFIEFYKEVKVSPRTIGIELLVENQDRAKESQLIFESFIQTSNRLYGVQDELMMEVIDDDELNEFLDCNDESMMAPSNRQQEILDLARNFKPIQRNDDWRQPDVAKEGGFPLNDPEVVTKFRKALKDVISEVGRKIFSGNFNLGQVSFPIYVMAPDSILYFITTMSIHSPLYMNAAALATDPVERLKFVMVQSISFLYTTHNWVKPLNPILGETFTCTHDDGTIVYMEQVVHHPPISYMLQVGPNEIYRWWGYSSFTPKPHMNSIDLQVDGMKCVEFKDGTRITFNPQSDRFLNTIWGTGIHQLVGRTNFKDEKNGLTAWYCLGGVKNRPNDYFEGEILRNGKVVSKMFGNYAGYLDFDGVRYWDVREETNYRIKGIDLNSKECAPSDCRNRIDSIELKKGNIDLAQQGKNTLETQQRADRKLREAAAKRRKEGGAKIVYYSNHCLHKN